jgi:hypothetical protein
MKKYIFKIKYLHYTTVYAGKIKIRILKYYACYLLPNTSIIIRPKYELIVYINKQLNKTIALPLHVNIIIVRLLLKISPNLDIKNNPIIQIPLLAFINIGEDKINEDIFILFASRVYSGYLVLLNNGYILRGINMYFDTTENEKQLNRDTLKVRTKRLVMSKEILLNIMYLLTRHKFGVFTRKRALEPRVEFIETFEYNVVSLIEMFLKYYKPMLETAFWLVIQYEAFKK